VKQNASNLSRLSCLMCSQSLFCQFIEPAYIYVFLDLAVPFIRVIFSEPIPERSKVFTIELMYLLLQFLNFCHTIASRNIYSETFAQITNLSLRGAEGDVAIPIIQAVPRCRDCFATLAMTMSLLCKGLIAYISLEVTKGLLTLLIEIAKRVILV
jgi:hypothetical protein